jgi:BMFP domain-containing protein YqiC
VSDAIWETFDSLFKTVHRQGRRVEELEARVLELERRLRDGAVSHLPQTPTLEQLSEMPTEKAA